MISSAHSRRLALCLLAVFAKSAAAQGLPVARPEDVGLSAVALDRIPAALQRYVDSSKMAGAVVAVARHAS